MIVYLVIAMAIFSIFIETRIRKTVKEKDEFLGDFLVTISKEIVETNEKMEELVRYTKEQEQIKKDILEKLEESSQVSFEDIATDMESMIAECNSSLNALKVIGGEFIEQKTNYIVVNSQECAKKIFDFICENEDFRHMVESSLREKEIMEDVSEEQI